MEFNGIEITKEMMEAVARAQLYRDDPKTELRKLGLKKMTDKEMNELCKIILRHPEFQDVKKDTIECEELTLVDDNIDTIMLYYNKLLRDAQFEKKYEVITKILGEIRKLKAIENEENRFEIIITVKKPEDNNKED